MHNVTKDALTLIIFSAVASIASYFYTFAMARMLSIEEYSLLYSIIALTYILTIPQETIRTVISVYTTKYNVKKQNGKIKGLMNFFLKRMFIFSIILFVIFLALSPLLVGLFHTNYWILIAAGTVLIFSFILPVIWGIYQGLGKFKALGINNSIEGLLKLGIGILLVSILPVTIKIYGALVAAPISILLAFLVGIFSFGFLKKFKAEKVKEDFKRYSLATFVIFGLVTIMYSVDIIMARYFLSPKTAGIYAGISLICKAFFFIATGTKRAMMPNLSAGNEKKQEGECQKILKKISLMMLILFVSAFVLFWIFPEQIVHVVLGERYNLAIPYLKYMIIAIAFFSFGNLLVYYNLAINKNKMMTARILASAAFLEIVLLILFHKSLMSFIIILMIIYALLFFAMLTITIIQPRHAEKEKKEFQELKKWWGKRYKRIKR
jgi:O-antigen/teichoic acid export membrane protein